MKTAYFFFSLLNVVSLTAFDYIFEVDGGVFDSDFRWNIASLDNSADVISLLEWKGLQGPYTDLTLRGECYSVFAFVEGEVAYVTKGRVVDSDYALPFQQALEQRAVSSAKGTLFGGVRAALGYSFFLWNNRFKADFSLGYRFDIERFRMKGGSFVYSSVPYFEAGMPLTGLDNIFTAKWLGMEGTTALTLREGALALSTAISLFFPKYLARGEWNLRTDFDGPFKQNGYGFGYTWRSDLTYFFTKWSFGLSFKLLERSVKGNHQNPYFDSDGTTLIGHAKLGEALFFSRVYTVNIGVPF